jgi:hypothetical protein
MLLYCYIITLKGLCAQIDKILLCLMCFYGLLRLSDIHL